MGNRERSNIVKCVWQKKIHGQFRVAAKLGNTAAEYRDGTCDTGKIWLSTQKHGGVFVGEYR